MNLTINFVSLYLLILVFTCQSQHTVGQDGGNGAQSKLVSEERAKEDSKKADDSPSIEIDHADDEDASWSSSSSSSEESGPFASSTKRTTSRPAILGTSALLGKKIKMMRVDAARLIKPRDARKADNWYAKRSANVGGAGSKQKSPQQRQKQSGRNVDGTPEEEPVKNEDEASPLDHNKAAGPTLGLQKPAGMAESAKGKINPFLYNKAGGQKGEAGALVNKTSKKPFNVERATRPVDPNVYSFFQFKPSESLGLLWTQSAGLGGRTVDMLGNDRGTDEDDLDPANKYDWEFRRYDRACMYVEYSVYKAQMNSTQVTEEVSRMVDSQNEQLARRFIDWQFINKESHEAIALKGEGEKHPLYLTYKFMTLTMEIFRDKICRNATPYATTPEVKHFAPPTAPSKAEANKKFIETRLLPKSFTDDLYRLFLTLRDITLPKGAPDYATKKDEEDIYTEVLEECMKLDPIQWYSHTCADQVLSYDQPQNYACAPLIDYDFNYKEYDPILDGMWHMFTAVHAFCFGEFNKRSTRLWHKYSMILANSFTVGMRTRWKASIAEPKFYMRLLGPDHETHLETINRCMFAATLRSSAPAVLPRFLSPAAITFGKNRTIAKDASENHPKNI